MELRLKHPVTRYLFALCAVGVTYALRRALDPVIGTDTPFVVLLFLPVMVSAWVAGPGPAFLAAALATVVGDTVSMNAASPAPMVARVVRVATFMLETLLLSALIEAHRRAARQLSISEERYRTLADNLPNGTVLLFDRELRYLIAGGSGLAEVGLSAPMLVGKTLREVAPPERVEELEALYRAALRGEHQVTELQLFQREYLTFVLPVRDKQGAIIAGMAMSQDVTERKRLEQKLRQAQKMDAVGRLAGGVAHDFNNLLTVILGRIELMQTLPLDEQALRADLNAVADAAQRAADLTQQLLTFSRQQSLQTQVVDLSALLHNMAPTLRQLVGEHIQLDLQVAEHPLHVRGNRGQLEQVVMNLCVNARDAIAGPGTIVLRSEHCQLDETTSVALPPGSYACLYVRDSGSGMDALTREHLFEPYFTTKGRGKGSGLGLSIVHGIVGQHHGHIVVSSQPGAGSEFHIYLPQVSAESAVLAPSHMPPTRRKAQGEVILVVDDDDEVRKLLHEFLQTAGYEVLAARDGEEALALVRKQPRVDVVVTDMVLPKMTGYELSHLLRQQRPRLRTVLVSGYSEQLVGLQHLEASGTLFLPKPFTLSDLLDRVDQLLLQNANPAQGPSDA